MSRDHPTRRTLLRAAGGTLAATLAGATGCLGRTRTGDGGGSTTGDRGSTTGDGGSRSYADWLPSRAALGIGEGFYAFSTLDVGEVVASRDRFADGEYGSFADRFGSEGGVFPPIESVDAVTAAAVSPSGTTLLVAEGSFSRGEAAAQLTDAGYGRAGEHGRFDLYGGTRGTFGVADGVLAGTTSDREGSAAMVRTVLDAGRDEAERLVDADGDADRLVAELGTGLNAVGVLTPRSFPEGYDPSALSAVGRSVRLADRGAEFELVLVYDDPGSVDVDAIEATAREDEATLARADGVSASASGRVATVTGTAPDDRMTFHDFEVWIGPDPDRTPPAPPEMAFDFEYDDAGTVAITHEGGDSFTGNDDGTLRYGVRGGTLRDWEPPVRAGDSVTVEGVESGDEVVVVWESAAGDRLVLGEFTVP